MVSDKNMNMEVMMRAITTNTTAMVVAGCIACALAGCSTYAMQGEYPETHAALEIEDGFHTDWYSPIERAQQVWNGAMGRDFFVSSCEGYEYCRTIKISALTGDEAKGKSGLGTRDEIKLLTTPYHWREGEIHYAQNPVPRDQRDSLIVHELGHALGLGHDKLSEDSIMNPSLTCTTASCSILVDHVIMAEDNELEWQLCVGTEVCEQIGCC